MVAPMPQQNEEEARPVVADPPTQSANPQGQVRPVVADPPTQVEVPPSDGNTVATAVEISDDSELSD